MDNKSAWQSFIEGDALLAEKTSEQVVKYSLGSENTALYCCILWPGMLLWANDVRDKYLPANEDVDTSFVTINYRLEGRCEASAGGRDVFIYMKPGMLCIDNHRPPDGYHFPSAKYKGIEFAFQMDHTRYSFPPELEQIAKTKGLLKKAFEMSDETADKFMSCFERFKPESIRNEYYTDLLTWLEDDIHVENTKVHFIYANKMGEKYLKRYKKYFRDPEIREFDMQHEQWLSVFFMPRKTGAFLFIAKKRIMNKNKIVLFETADNEVSLQVQMQDETVWLTANQMAQLFETLTTMY